VQQELEVFILIDISIALGNKEYLYFDSDESILCLDQTRQYNLTIDEADLYYCKTRKTVPYISTQSHAVAIGMKRELWNCLNRILR
jgi:hypothetical protein